MATVTLENLHKSYGKVAVIHGVDIDIKDGEFIVIVGPSGCGKSTLLRMVAGLEGVSDGEVRIDGKRVNEKEPMDRDIAMVFQNYALYPHMSVAQNMGYGLKIAKTPKAEIDTRVAEAARLLQLEPYLDRRPRELSGGQRQRVAMGRAIVRRPSVFLFDEPLSNLDAKLRVQMRLEIKQLQRELGVTALYVTHDQVEAMTLADRMIVMNAGVAEQIGAPLEVYANPRTAFVAGFIGSPPTNFMAAPDGGQIGVRPEHVSVVAPDAGNVTGRVQYTEPLGAETLVHVILENGETATVRQDGTVPIPAEKQDVGLAWDKAVEMRFGSDGVRVDAR
ncbi:ABC transporter ATP-binding protein [Oceaniglobus indicus]|uniref:ABC transporter ATP-binding protein n=1 Tax=Oceaniglobus indicus TaxID=2047749 RepID=UPI000C192994|nr:sn-glycerol-3-phosphate ABC transporter ATP-binding protein UgpC [Oceaniglobus indicus]